MDGPAISVIVPTRNGGMLWHETLRAVLRQRLVASFEIIVIDSESSDDTPAVTRHICADPGDNPAGIPLTLIQIPVREFRHGGTRNLGAAQARGELLVFLSQDATPVGSEWLAELVRPFDDPGVVGAFCRQIARSTAPIAEQYNFHKSYPRRSRIFTAADFGSSNEYFCDAASAMRKSIWERYPLPDVLMGEDARWAVQVLAAGYSIAYAAVAEVLHSHQYNPWQHLKRNFDTGAAIEDLAPYSTQRSGRYMRSLRQEVVFVLHRGGIRRLPEMCLYEAITILGFLLGSNNRRLPPWLCRRLTHFPQWFPDRA